MADALADLLREIENMRKERGELRTKNAALEAELTALKTMGEKVNGIRNSIVGTQTINWSEHIYPLVAALEEAGIKGMPYPEAMRNIGTVLQQLAALRKDVREAVGELRKLGNYEHPAKYNSCEEYADKIAADLEVAVRAG